MRSIIDEEPSKTAVLLGIIIGTVSFIAFFGLARAFGTDPVYAWPAGDQAQHIAGAFAYLDAGWSFPLFETDRLNVPDGLNIIFTDSAPFAGLIAKIIHSLFGIRFNYLGSWFAVLWIGQAAGGAYLARQFGLRHPLIIGSAAVIALAWPSFLNRHFHLALGSHFLLLFALGLYLKTIRQPDKVMTAFSWSLMLGVALWTHAYLFAMSFPLCIAAYGDAMVQRKMKAGKAAVLLGIMSAWCLFLAYIGGYHTVGNINAIGYGAFQLDLLAYLWPHGSGLVNAPVIFSMPSAFEGFNYLGMGGLLCVVAGMFFVRSSHLLILRNHLLLVFCVVGMLAFAVTNNITLGGQQLLHFDIPVEQFPFSTFRASGRFGWVFGYVVVFGFFALIMQSLWRRSQALAATAAVMIAILQAYDAHILLGGMKEGWTTKPKPALEAAVNRASFVHFWPPIDCLLDDISRNAAMEALSIVARAGILTDGAHIARGTELNCSRSPQKAASGTLTITPAAIADDNPHCTIEASLRFCTHNNRQVSAVGEPTPSSDLPSIGSSLQNQDKKPG